MSADPQATFSSRENEPDDLRKAIAYLEKELARREANA